MTDEQTKQHAEALRQYRALPKRERRMVDKGQRMNKTIIQKINGSLLEEVELILTKRSTLNRAERDFVLAVTHKTFKLAENEKN